MTRWKVFIDDICQVNENKQNKTENCPSNQAVETVMFSLHRIVLFTWISSSKWKLMKSRNVQNV